MMRARASAEIGSEDPTVVTLNAVVTENGTAAAAAGDADERTRGVFRIVFAARRFLYSSGVEDVGHDRGRLSDCEEL